MDADLFSLDIVVESLRTSGDAERLREAILDLASLYAEIRHAPVPFVPGASPVPVSGKVCGPQDMRSLVDSALDFWLTTGRFVRGPSGVGGERSGWDVTGETKPHERSLPRLDRSKAQAELGWRPAWPLAEAIRQTVVWCREVARGVDPRHLTFRQNREHAEASARAAVA